MKNTMISKGVENKKSHVLSMIPKKNISPINFPMKKINNKYVTQKIELLIILNTLNK